jgi:hypothetical protein
MQDRIRQILEEQIAMRGDSRSHYGGAFVGGIGPSKKSKAAAKNNPWINYLKCAKEKTGIPYKELMINPNIKELYHGNSEYLNSGSGDLMGGAPLEGKYYPKIAAALKKRYGASAVTNYKSTRSTGLKKKAKKRVVKKTGSKSSSKRAAVRASEKKLGALSSEKLQAFMDSCF